MTNPDSISSYRYDVISVSLRSTRSYQQIQYIRADLPSPHAIADKTDKHLVDWISLITDATMVSSVCDSADL